MYNKLFTKILDSSIWLESTPTRIVWLTFIACMDEAGFVQFAAIGNVAHRARVTLEEAQEAIRALENPDLESSDPDHEGRRIERVPGGWMVLNAEKHRKLVTRAVIQEQTRLRVRKHREKKRSGNARVTPSEAEAEAEARSEAEAEKAREETCAQESPGRPTYQKTPIIPKNPHLGHVFCDPTFCYCVPPAVHHKLTELLAPKHHGDREAAQSELRDWYAAVASKLVDGFVMGDSFKFWQGRFDAEFASPDPKAQAGKLTTRMAAAIANIQRETANGPKRLR